MLQDVAILDIGSGKIRVLAGRRGVNNTIIINGMGESDYAGFSGGEWFDPDQLVYSIGHAIAKAESNARMKISQLYVGVPGDFTTCVCKDLNISFTRKRKITADDVSLLHDQGSNFSSDPNYALIHSQPIYYTLDDDRRLIQPEGLPSTKLGGCISYLLAEKNFMALFNVILDNLGITKVEYVSALLAETLFLFDDIKRDQYVVLLDIGHITSSALLARGDGILSQYSFPLGGGYITGNLAMGLGISYAQAESLKSKVLLSLDPDENDIYEVVGGDENLKFNAKQVNEIVLTEIAKIASTIQKCLKLCKYEYPDHIPYHLTGGGLAYIYGAKDILSQLLDRQVEIVVPRLPHYNKPHFSSSLGMLDMVLAGQENEPQKGFFARLLAKIKGQK